VCNRSGALLRDNYITRTGGNKLEGEVRTRLGLQGDSSEPYALTERTIELDNGNYKKTWDQTTPNGKCATTADIAYTALFLLAGQSSHITSQAIVVDGGWTATSPPPL